MSLVNQIRTRPRKQVALALAGGVAAIAAVAGCGSGSGSSSAATTASTAAAAVGQPPPEWAANAGEWPAHNYDLSNSRATTQSPINSQNVSRLKVKWTFHLKGGGAFGAFSSTPIALNGTVYFQDLDSNVYALDRATGKLRWRHAFNQPSVGPNGVAFGNGRIYGATEESAFALDAQTGKLVWSRRLIRNNKEGVDMTPQPYDDKVLISTIPGNVSSFYKGGAEGVVWALDAATGKPRWTFNTIADGAKLFGNPKVNSGGGLWYPPAVDNQGRVFISVANPAPLYGTKTFPNGSSRPGPDLYTNSLVALDGQTGRRLWFRQTVPHDIRDYDLQIPAITTTVPIGGAPTEIVLVAGKMGKVFAYKAADGTPLWTRPVGKHENDTGPLPQKLTTVFPGDLGGVETPMALASGRLFVPWLNFPVRARAQGLPGGLAGTLSNFKLGRGGFTAFDAGTGKVEWQRKLPSMDFGAATVANDVVFTSDYAGTVYAFDTQTGKTLWTKKAPAGINSFPAVDGDTLLVGAGTTGFDKKPKFELIAYSLQSRQAATATKGHASVVADQVRGKEFSFKLVSKSIRRPGTVTFRFRNVGTIQHDFKIDGKRTPLIAPGKTASITVRFKKPGKYRYICTVPGHAAAGMRGVFTVG